MELTIKASQNFEEFLKKYDSQITVTKSEQVCDDVEYNSKLAEYAGQVFISLAVSVVSPFITDAIKDYVETNNEEVVVITENEQYIISPTNVKDISPLLHNDVLAILGEENDGKNR
jgi:hypothetical protein